MQKVLKFIVWRYFKQSVQFQGNSGNDSAVYYCEVICESDFSRTDDTFYV